MGERTREIVVEKIPTRLGSSTIASEHETNHMSLRSKLDDLVVQRATKEQSVDFVRVSINPSPSSGLRGNSRSWKANGYVSFYSQPWLEQRTEEEH